MAAEKVAENILEDLFTTVLDWSLADVNNQVDYADIVLTRLGIKHLLVEVKRPGALIWHRRAVSDALDQARRYADQQLVGAVAVSDGTMLYACDRNRGGAERDRLFVHLDDPKPPVDLWWLSVDGIYRARDDVVQPGALLPDSDGIPLPRQPAPANLLHPKYGLPARCFGYVGNAADAKTWHLPYLEADGTPDLKRLPKAIQAILSNYRGAHVTAVPEAAVSDVLVTLGRTASRLGKLPATEKNSAKAYWLLQQALEQLGRLNDVLEI